MKFEAILALHRAGQLKEAEAGYRALIAQNTPIVSAFSNLAAICIKTDRVAEAITLLKETVRRDPEFAQAFYNLGLALQKQSRNAEALEAYGRAIALEPGLIDAHANLGICLGALARYDDSIAKLKQVLAAAPTHFEAWTNLGRVLSIVGKPQESVAAHRRAIKIKPDDPRGHSNLAAALYDANLLSDAQAENEAAIALDPAHYVGHLNCGNIAKDRGRPAEAVARYERAIALEPTKTESHANLLYTLSLTQHLPWADYFAASKRYEDSLRADIRGAVPPARPIDMTRKLRVGFMSAEIGNHAVAFFLESYLRSHDRDKIHVSLYPTMWRAEARRDVLLGLADQWRSLVGLDDDAAAQIVRDDAIDILIDTTAHMMGGRMGVIMRRPAPVQVHYIGFHGSPGLTGFDYFIGDDVVTPPACDAQFVEKVWRLPRLWVGFNVPEDAPDPGERTPGAPITFGSFNTLAKVREETLSAWAEVMHAVPGSRLLIKDRLCADDVSRNRVLDTLAHNGIAADRITLLRSVATWREHMSLYDQVDVALDAFPLNSGTTAFDALYMGVPLVTIRGTWMGGLMSAAILQALGHPEWIAADRAGFVRIATGLAADADARAGIKKTLRADVVRSPMVDTRGLSVALDEAFLQMADRNNASLARVGPSA